MPNIFLKNEFFNFSSTWIKFKGLHYMFYIKDAFGLRTLGAAIVKHKDISGAPGRISVFEKGHIYSNWPTSMKVLSSGCVSGPVECISLVTQWRGNVCPQPLPRVQFTVEGVTLREAYNCPHLQFWSSGSEIILGRKQTIKQTAPTVFPKELFSIATEGETGAL